MNQQMTEQEIEQKNEQKIEHKTADTSKQQKKISEREVMELVVLAGEILSDSGAEIFRVEETMDRICRAYGMHSGSMFVLSNGIFVTAGDADEECFARVKTIPVKSVRLDRVAAVNQLSREIEAGQHTVTEALEKMRSIQRMPGKTKKMQILAAGVSSACCSWMFGGNAGDSTAAFLAGVVLYLYVIYISRPYFSKIVGTIGGGALATFVCVCLHSLHFGSHLNQMIVGGIMPLIPGVAFTNGIRDMADGDYLSGSVRLLDAILVFLCIAAGVGMVIHVYHNWFGGVML